jgi:hypothetical protein
MRSLNGLVLGTRTSLKKKKKERKRGSTYITAATQRNSLPVADELCTVEICFQLELTPFGDAYRVLEPEISSFCGRTINCTSMDQCGGSVFCLLVKTCTP